MKIGIICEFNPLHNGHLFLINKVRELYKDCNIVIILNGYFLQRGEISILSKEDKTKLVLEHNVDLVVELPFVYGSQSADYFALASINILNHLNCDYLIFGSESNNIDYLYEMANKMNEITIEKELLSKGFSYPKLLDLDIKNPNDLLGISYIKAIINTKSNIKPVVIKRTNDYHDLNSDESIISASNIRNKLNNNIDVSKYIPVNSNILYNNINKDVMFSLLKYKINTDKDLSRYLDVDEGIENRIIKYINIAKNYDDLVIKIKSKRYTYNKINRMFIHILLSLTKEDISIINNDFNYFKVLGFNNNGKKILKNIELLNNELIRKYEINSSVIYDIICKTNTYEFEIKNKPVIVK